MQARPLRHHRGQILVMTALSLVILVAMVGLALDAGVGYLIRAKLNAAVDAAGVAAARAVVVGSNQAEQGANAQRAAINFFNANYPAGYWFSTPTLDTPVVAFEQGKVTIDISATARVPVHFMQVMDFSFLDVRSQAQVVRKDLDMAFVMDTTDSMLGVAGTVRTAAKTFLDQFSTSTDRVSLIHFAHGAVVDVPFKADQSRGFDRATMKARIDAYAFSGFTNYADGFWNARDQLNNKIAMANRSSLRVIVFFSDGSPNTFASYFAFNRSPTGAGCASLVQGSGPYWVPGALQTAASCCTVDGLWRFDVQTQALPGQCYIAGGALGAATSPPHLTATALPDWYNPHDRVNEHEFRVITNSPRVVTNATSGSDTTTAYRNINRAARNLPEAMAATARAEGIYVYALGLGAHAREGTGPDDEDGETLMKCMANTTDALPRCRNAAQPTGVYCWAATEHDLAPCFAKLASEITRLTR